MSQQTEAQSAIAANDALQALLAKAATLPDYIDTTHFREGSPDEQPVAQGSRISLKLCEYLAYKAALSYEKPARIEAHIDACCEPGHAFRFFDSRKRKIADTQAYGFRHDGKTFIVFRGTEGKQDWEFNLQDGLTTTLADATDWRTKLVEARFGKVSELIGDTSPGRHVGFTLAWAGIRQEVYRWLDDLPRLPDGSRCPIVLSGHSLGGALALLAGYELAKTRSDLGPVAAVVTFGAPLVGNADFAKAYADLLGEKTVCLESSGDLVPAVMRRWYYRWLRHLRHWAQSGLRPDKNGLMFQSVGQRWTFEQEPVLSPAELAEKLRRVQQQLEEATRAIKRAANDTQGKSHAQSDEPGNETANGRTQSKGEDQQPETKPATTNASDSSGSGSNRIIMLVGGTLVVLIIAGVAWYFVRRKLFQHDIEQRYALYLSTLSYQQLRALHGGDLASANVALAQHLRDVRGEELQAAAGKPYFAAVSTLPVRLEPRDDAVFKEYLKSAFV